MSVQCSQLGLSCAKAVLKSMLCLLHNQDLNLHFPIYLESAPAV